MARQLSPPAQLSRPPLERMMRIHEKLNQHTDHRNLFVSAGFSPLTPLSAAT
jgi:hypothetical protein